MNDILILGATGKTGRRVTRRLHERNLPVRAASRSSAVRFDWTDPDTWEPATHGVGAVYLVAPDDPAPIRPFVEGAKGVERFVVLSGRGMDHVQSGFGEGMAEAERAVQDSGATWTILRANNFAQNFNEDLWHAPVRAGRLALPTGGVPEPFVDVEDIADVAVAALTEDGHAERIYDLSGPEALSWDRAVEIIARAAGRPIEFAELTPAEYQAELRADGLPPEFAGALGVLFEVMRTGALAEVADGVERALGRPAAPFHEYVARVAPTGAWSR
ncbi:NAD(P)H-binding protein [Spongiactinospora sp. TRM90649]|uniref:NAD(P)H-binding protein n=1 Tax=Spongiactinospora sp. TRM90649 TaxID=3031114 RepID=UPI0023F9B116|nr:NAD(P)H-binding protein [Spongiactinospora sp. TRM90649]MDF5751554.1 NAD(P)H-binding protein [Spongiactinospora sp. TRM90649]